jgi:hypothetical protein
MSDDPLAPRDRCVEHLALSTAQTPLLCRLVLYRAVEMLDLRQLNELVEFGLDAEDAIERGAHGDHHAALLRRARRL